MEPTCCEFVCRVRRSMLIVNGGTEVTSSTDCRKEGLLILASLFCWGFWVDHRIASFRLVVVIGLKKIFEPVGNHVTQWQEKIRFISLLGLIGLIVRIWIDEWLPCGWQQSSNGFGDKQANRGPLPFGGIWRYVHTLWGYVFLLNYNCANCLICLIAHQ